MNRLIQIQCFSGAVLPNYWETAFICVSELLWNHAVAVNLLQTKWLDAFYSYLQIKRYCSVKAIAKLSQKWHMQHCHVISSRLRLLFWICEQLVYVTDERSMGSAEGSAGPHHIFDSLHFLLVAMAVLHGSFFCLLQRTLERLNSLGCRPKTFLQFWKLAAQICIVTYQL